MLQPILSSLIKFDHHLFHCDRVAVVAAIFQDLFVELVCHQREWLWSRRCRDLPDEIVPKLVLNPRFLQENSIRPHVKHSVVLLT